MKSAMLTALGTRGWYGKPGCGALSKGRATMLLRFNTYRASLELLLVPKELRGQGLGNESMKDLTAAADEVGAVLTLTVMPMDRGGPDEAALTRLYSAHGFLPGGRGAGGEPLMNRAPIRTIEDGPAVSALDGGPK